MVRRPPSLPSQYNTLHRCHDIPHLPGEWRCHCLSWLDTPTSCHINTKHIGISIDAFMYIKSALWHHHATLKRLFSAFNIAAVCLIGGLCAGMQAVQASAAVYSTVWCNGENGSETAQDWTTLSAMSGAALGHNCTLRWERWSPGAVQLAACGQCSKLRRRHSLYWLKPQGVFIFFQLYYYYSTTTTTFRLPCQRCSKGMQLPHTRPTSCLQSAVWRPGPDSGVQHRGIQAWLLQRYAVRCARHHLRRPAMGSEQLGQSRLSASARRSNRR